MSDPQGAISLTETLAAFISKAGFENLSPAALRSGKMAIADCVGCMLAGSATDTAAKVRSVVKGNLGRRAATLLGQGGKVPVPDAALVNGVAGHALDYDDINWSLCGHPSVVMLPAALAVAETEGRSGRDLLTAYAVGVEVAAKLGRFANPTHYGSGWHATATLGVIGAAAAVAKLLGVPEQRVVMALGIAASQAAGLRRNFGSMTKPLHAGNAARAGVTAAQLAHCGFTADRRALEGHGGWFQTLQGAKIPTPRELNSALGQPWDIEEPGIVLKRYPSCGATHCALDAIVELQAAPEFRLEEVSSVRCAVHPLAFRMLQHSRPGTGLEGKFSMEFCLAVALLEGPPRLRHFTDRWARDPRVIGLLPRISVETHPQLAKVMTAESIPAEVTVTFRDGSRVSRQVSVPAGDPGRPLGHEDCRSKFLECADGILRSPVARNTWSQLEKLEDVRDLGPLLDRLGGSGISRRAHRS